MWVLRPRGGADFSARSIASWLVVSGNAVRTAPLNSTIPSCCCGLRWLANTRAAATAPRIGSPRMLPLVSITSTTASSFVPAVLAGSTERFGTGRPFSRTCTADGAIASALGRERTYERPGDAVSLVRLNLGPAAAAGGAGRRETGRGGG